MSLNSSSISFFPALSAGNINHINPALTLAQLTLAQGVLA